MVEELDHLHGNVDPEQENLRNMATGHRRTCLDRVSRPGSAAPLPVSDVCLVPTEVVILDRDCETKR